MHRKNFFSQRRRLNSSKKYFLTGAVRMRAKQFGKVFSIGRSKVQEKQIEKVFLSRYEKKFFLL